MILGNAIETTTANDVIDIVTDNNPIFIPYQEEGEDEEEERYV